MSLFGLFINILASLSLTLIPGIILRKNNMRVTLVICFFSLTAASIVGGLINTLTVSLFLLLYFLWIRFSIKKSELLFNLTFVLTLMWIFSLLISLPIRIYLERPEVLIAGNVAGLLMISAMISGCIEFITFNKKRISMLNSSTYAKGLVS